MKVNLLNYLFNYVIITSKENNIDESHSLKHSMDVYYNSNKILEYEIKKYPNLINYKDIIYSSAILHDMCDKKYMNEIEGSKKIEEYLKSYIEKDKIDKIIKIITSMSYSTVKKYGYPNLDLLDSRSYHIVREADLLASYDFDRCIMYQMYKYNDNYEDSFKIAKELFENRVLKYNSENLFTSEYSKLVSKNLEIDAIKKILFLNNFVNI
jgi:HD superfamily phosphodiesterase